jgi:hypothetical protein
MLTLNNFQLKTTTLGIDYFQKRRPPLDGEGPPAITGIHKKWQRGIVSFCRPHLQFSAASIRRTHSSSAIYLQLNLAQKMRDRTLNSL